MLAARPTDAGDAPFIQSLALIERESTDERKFVKKAGSLAL